MTMLIGGCGRSVGQARPAVEHVIIVSVDGLRPDMMLRNNAPVMRSLMRGGCYTKQDQQHDGAP